MPEHVAAAFAAAARVKRYRRGQVLYTQGDRSTELYRIIDGSVRLSARREDGREMLFVLLEPGDCFGDSSLVDLGPRPQSAEAQGDVEVQVLRRDAYLALCAAHQEMNEALLRLFAQQMRLMIGYLADAHLQDVASRVASRIISAATSFGMQTNRGIELSVKFSQSELAAMVGASRQTVNKILQNFQADNLLETDYGNLIIHDIDRLKQMIGTD